MIKLNKETKLDLIHILNTKNVFLEGNIIKLIDSDGDLEFEDYLKKCAERDVLNRRKRLEITKKIQSQNNELSKLNEHNEKILFDLQQALNEAEESKKKIEAQNSELINGKEENDRISQNLREEMANSEKARKDAESAKENAENDLDILQKKTQFQLISTIVKVALGVILGVGLVTTLLYIVAMFTGKDTQIIGSTWSNMFGILLTNAFSIIGTIMGVKYASENLKKEGE
jgi:hypothetical protein